MDKIKELIRCLSKEQLQKLLLEQCEKDEGLQQTIMNLTNDVPSNEDQKAIEAIIKNHPVSHIHCPKDMLDFGNDIIAYLDDHVFTYIKSKEYLKSAELALYIVNRLSDLDFTNYERMYFDLQERICEIFAYVADHAQGREEVKEWYQDVYKGTTNLELKDILEFLLIEAFEDFDLAKSLLMQTKEQLATHQELQLPDFIVDQLVRKTLFYLHALDTPYLEVLDFAKEYIHYPACTNLRLAEYIENGYTRDLLEFLQYAALCASDYREEVDDKILSVFAYLKDNLKVKDYREELLAFILSTPQDQLHYVHMLKKSCTEKQWLKLREEVKDGQLMIDAYAQFLYEEGMIEELLEEIKDCEYVDVLFEYINDLMQACPKQTITRAIEIIRELASFSTNRDQYKQIAKMLNILADFEVCNDELLDFVNELKQTYHMKRTFMQELNKVKINPQLHFC